VEPIVKEPKTEEINLDALAAPDGTAPDNFELFKERKQVVTPSTSWSDLPNLDPVPEPENKDNLNKTPQSTPAPPQPTSAPPSENGKLNGETPWLQRPFKDLQKKLELTDEEFGKLIDLTKVTEDNYLDEYNRVLYENTEFEESTLHPELKKINELVAKGVDFNKALSAYQKMNNLVSLSDKELVTLSLKQQFGKNDERKDGWDDAKINERILKMDNVGYLEIEAERIRNQIKAEKENINASFEAQAKADNATRMSEQAEARNKEIEKSIKYLDSMENLYGLPVSKAEKAEFRELFRASVTPDKEGKLPINTMLQSNEGLVRFVISELKANSKVKETLTKIKEDAKKSIIDKLDDEPILPKKTAPYLNEGAIDLDKLSQPART
jgi:hypothetical protein